MRHVPSLRVLSILAAAAAAALVAPFRASAQTDASDFRQTVARVSFVQGDASFQRGDDPDHWQPIAINVPMTIGDRVFTDRGGRVELEAPGLRAFVAPGTELTTLNLTEDVQQYSLAEGTATFRVSYMDEDDVFEIDTPNAAVTLSSTGLYRIQVDADGNTRVYVRRGDARVASGGGEVSLRTGELMVVNGIDEPEYDVYALPLADSWDRWVDSRERRRHEVAAYDYTSPDVVGAEDLDAYGTWEDVPEYGTVWRPSSVPVDWEPYRFGRWIWQDPWGWTWVSDEPWGWAPYHYGRWAFVSSRWCWVPVGPRVRHVAYAPALVAFVGGGPGWSVSVGVGGGGFVGWFPLAPREPFDPWWGARARVAPPPSFAYANRSRAVVVDRTVFVSARPVAPAIVRDRRVVTEVSRAPVLRGPLPVVPTQASIRVTPVERAVPRPPQNVVARPVAARLAPPPAPPAFERKVEVIQRQGGAPLTPSAAARLSVQAPAGARAPVPIRPVVREDRRVELAPRRGAEGAPPPDPIHAGVRPIASAQAPIIPNPSAREPMPSPRLAPGAVVPPRPPVSPGETAPMPPRNVAPPPAVPRNVPPQAVVSQEPAPRERETPHEREAPPRNAPPPQPAPRYVPPQAAAPHVSPPPPVAAASPNPNPPAERAIERREFSRPPRRIAEPAPDPLVHAPAPPQRPPAEHVAPPRGPEKAQERARPPQSKNELPKDKEKDKKD